MKKCNNCGCINEDTQMFCGQCGSKLNDFSIDTTQDSQNTYYTQPQPPQQQFTSSQYPTPPTNDKPKKKKKGCLVTILIVLGVLILLGIIGGLASSDDDTTTTENPTQSTSDVIQEKTTKKTETTTQSKSEFTNTCQEYSYKEIARDPNNYKGKPAKFKGQVIQVQESGKTIVLRVNVTAEENEFAEGGYLYEDTIYVEYTKKDSNESRILEDDIITIYGTLNGLMTYESILGEEISIPHLIAEYIDIETA